ncbi:MAG: hypothetical protein EA369_10175 [Bradymonadales bacterium]|nr:MAG: hypothetical protein EA369_10175 [Bradymonadales bacterium]
MGKNQTDFPKKKELQELLTLALRLSYKAGKNSLKLFESKLSVESKSDDSPVTRADREAEDIIRTGLEKSLKAHEVIGEEFGSSKKSSEFRWWIDPIDGTLQFIRGLPFWGSVLGLEFRGEVILGVLHFPAIGLSIDAFKSGGTRMNEKKKLKVSKASDFSKALFLHSSLRGLEAEEERALLKTSNLCRDNRGIGDAFGHSLVIRGIADALVDFRVNPYDVSAVKICVEEAGGKFSGLSGKSTIYERSILCSNARLHDSFLKSLSSKTLPKLLASEAQ